MYTNPNTHVQKGGREKQSPRLQSRTESLSGPSGPVTDFIPNGNFHLKKLSTQNLDVLTRNTASNLFHINERQQKIYNALALASICRFENFSNFRCNTRFFNSEYFLVNT